jgi:tripartite-type tricarboxylate transporter receptor subunit TctC
VRALGVSSSKRNALLPDVPTFSEAGVAGFDFSFFYGVCARAATPAPTVGTLQATLAKVMQMPEVRERLAQHGFDPKSTTSEEFETVIRTDTAKWTRFVKEAGITVD